MPKGPQSKKGWETLIETQVYNELLEKIETKCDVM